MNFFLKKGKVAFRLTQARPTAGMLNPCSVEGYAGFSILDFQQKFKYSKSHSLAFKVAEL